MGYATWDMKYLHLSMSSLSHVTYRVSLFGPFGAILGPLLLTIFDSRRIQNPPHDVIPHARQVLDPSAAYHDYRVLLKIMPFAGDVGRDLHAVCQPDAADFTKRGVRLSRSRREYLKAHTPLEG